MSKYEAHLTYGFAPMALLRESLWEGWHRSVIDGDPDLGSGARTYLTRHSDDVTALWGDMMALTDRIFNNHNVLPIRMKIERIVFDTKTKVNEMEKERAW